MEETRIISLQMPQMAVKVKEGMDPMPERILQQTQTLIARMRKQGKSDKQIQKFFRIQYKVELHYV
jgi:hypothetical protein